MHCEHIKYKDFDGNERSEDFYFNLTQAEVTDWLMTEGDYTIDKVLGRIIEKRNGKAIIDSIRTLIERSYGEKSLDGRQFIKTPEVKAAFMNTEAYSQLFMRLIGDAEEASKFINAIIPQEMSSKVQEILDKNPEAIPDELKDYLPKKDEVPVPVTTPAN